MCTALGKYKLLLLTVPHWLELRECSTKYVEKVYLSFT